MGKFLKRFKNFQKIMVKKRQNYSETICSIHMLFIKIKRELNSDLNKKKVMHLCIFFVEISYFKYNLSFLV